MYSISGIKLEPGYMRYEEPDAKEITLASGKIEDYLYN